MPTLSPNPVIELKAGTVLDVAFPALNKNDTLSRNDREIERRCHIGRSIIRLVITLSCEAEWQSVTENLLDDMAMWEKIGGSTLIGEDDNTFSTICAERGVDPDDFFSIAADGYTLDWFRNRAVTQVVAVLCEGKEPFFVNTEGYTYARYVGRMVEPPTANYGGSAQAISKV